MTHFGLLRESGCTIPSYGVPEGQEQPKIVKIASSWLLVEQGRVLVSLNFELYRLQWA